MSKPGTGIVCVRERNGRARGGRRNPCWCCFPKPPKYVARGRRRGWRRSGMWPVGPVCYASLNCEVKAPPAGRLVGFASPHPPPPPLRSRCAGRQIRTITDYPMRIVLDVMGRQAFARGNSESIVAFPFPSWLVGGWSVPRNDHLSPRAPRPPLSAALNFSEREPIMAWFALV